MTEERYHELMHRVYRAIRRRVTLRCPDHDELDFIVLQAFRREVEYLELEQAA